MASTRALCGNRVQRHFGAEEKHSVHGIYFPSQRTPNANLFSFISLEFVFRKNIFLFTASFVLFARLCLALVLSRAASAEECFQVRMSACLPVVALHIS